MEEAADHSNVVGEKAGSSKAYSHRFPAVDHTSRESFKIAKITLASDRIKEFGLTGEFSHSDASVVTNGLDPVGAKAHIGRHGSGLKDIILGDTTVAHRNVESEIFKRRPITGTADDAINSLSLTAENFDIILKGIYSRKPRGSGVDGIAGVNKNLTKTTGDNIDTHV